MFSGWLGNRSGNIPIITALLAIPLVVIVGGSVDFMRHEMARASLQNGLDRGVLAAASLTQSKKPRETIEGYMQLSGVENYDLDVSETVTLNSKVISASVSHPLKVPFLSLIGIDTININARSKAEERRQKIEISMVLDLSGSMRLQGRIQAMRPAAKAFVTRLLREESKDYTSISLVPYAGQVSVGASAFDALAYGGSVRTHDRSSCFGYLNKTFAAAIPDFTKAEHVPQFSSWLVGTNTGFDPWNCPTEETSVSFLSNDPSYLSSQIDGYHMFDGTGTQIAMKWGLQLLDPAFKSSLKKMADHGGPTVNPKFADRPAPFNDGETLKVIVLMTDGEVVPQIRPKSGQPVNPQPTTGGTYTEKVSKTQALDMLVSACTAAKNSEIVIYTVGFDVNTSDANFLAKLKGCASSPSHYYDATASDLNSVFQNIAGAIERVHLVGY